MCRDDFSFSAKLFLVFIIIYFPMMTVLPLTIDGELAAVSAGRVDWVAQGRWSNYLIEKYLFRAVVPYFTIAFFGACISLGYMLLLRACRLPYDHKYLLAFAIFAGFPIWSTILEFPANTLSVGLGVLACVMAVTSSQATKSYLLIPLQVLLVTFAVGSYQSFVFVYISLAMLVIVFAHENNRESVFRVLLVATVSVMAVALHHIIQEIFLRSLGLSLSYVGTFFNPSLLLSDPLRVFSQTAGFMSNIFKGKASFYGASLWAAPVIAVMGLIVAARRSWFVVLMLFAALLAPLPLVVVAGGWLPVRALISIPLALGGCALIILSSRNQLIQITGGVLCTILAVQSAAAISQYQAQRTLISIYDQSTAAAIYQRIGEVSGADRPIIVDLYGGLKTPEAYPVIATSTASGSFFSWNGGNPWRILAFMRLIGYTNLQLADLPTREAMRTHAETMPVWPAVGSVQRFGEVVVVKLGETPGVYSH